MAQLVFGCTNSMQLQHSFDIVNSLRFNTGGSQHCVGCGWVTDRCSMAQNNAWAVNISLFIMGKEWTTKFSGFEKRYFNDWTYSEWCDFTQLTVYCANYCIHSKPFSHFQVWAEWMINFFAFGNTLCIFMTPFVMTEITTLYGKPPTYITAIEIDRCSMLHAFTLDRHWIVS